MTVLRYMRRLFAEQPIRILLVVASLTIAGFLEGMGVALLVPLLSSVGGSNVSDGSGLVVGTITRVFAFVHLPLTITSILVVIFLIGLTQQSITLVQQKLLFGTLYRFQADLRHALYSAIFNAGWPFFLNQKIGNLTNALTVEVTRAGQAFYYLSLFASMNAVVFVYLILAALLSAKITFATILVGAALIGLVRKRIMKATVYGSDITTANAELQSEATEQIMGGKLIKGCAVEESTINQFNKYLNSLAKSYFQTSLNQAWLKSIFEQAAIGIVCVGIYVAVVLWHTPLANLVVFLFIFYRLAPRLSNSQTVLHQALADFPALDLIDKIHDEALAMAEKSGGRIINDMESRIAFEKVSFSYVTDTPVLSGVDIEIKSGQTTAIVGGSGAGKTTVIDLVLALLSPNQGRVIVDGIDLSEIDLKSWRRLLGYVAQDTILFHETVKENIAWGMPDIATEEIERAATLAYAHEFITQLPQGYDTVVGDRGVKLSGGQRQRLALARALARKPKLLILDEATSALDAESEHKIQAAVESLSGSMTVLVVTHRLATVKFADIIYVLEDGRVVEAGTWDELEQKGGRLHALKKLQALE